MRSPLFAILAGVLTFASVGFSEGTPPAAPQAPPAKAAPAPKVTPKVTEKKLWNGKTVKFVDRTQMTKRALMRSAKLPAGTPATVLPVDCTGNATVSCPMDGNDVLGICGPAMAGHSDNIFTFGQGKPGWTQSFFDLTALEQQYLAVSGGDNGTDEDDVVNKIWKPGIAGNKQAVILDSLDVDITNVALTQYCIDQFYTVQMAWSVPDKFLDTWVSGSVWSGAGVPNPQNGHYTTMSDVGGPNTVAGDGTNLNGYVRNWTWGGWDWMSPAFIASVQPQTFVAFSTRQFSTTTGLDSHGRHVSTQAAKWAAIGGNTISPSAISAFPPLKPTPAPTPTPIPTPTPVPVPVPVPTPAGATAITVIVQGQTFTIDTTTQTVTGPAAWSYPANTSAAAVRRDLTKAGFSLNEITLVLNLLADIQAKAPLSKLVADFAAIVAAAP